MNAFIKSAAVAALSTGLMFAQGIYRPRAATPPDPATMIANEVARLTTLLDLTSSQAGQITSILTAAQSAISGYQTTLATDRTSLATAVTGNNTGTIDSLSASIGTLQGQILDTNSKAEASIYLLLTSTQQTKLNTLGGVGMLGIGPGGPGGPGGRGPGPGPGPGGN